MYWTHLIFVLLIGVLLTWPRITASKPGYLDFDNLPETNFSCDGKVIGGYYADVETGCQMFHVCTIGQKGEVTDIKFLCLNGTVFDQETRVCERIDEVDCSKSEDFFGLNLELYGNNAHFGIQPENEFECEDCSTDQTGEDDEYEESAETTTYTTSTTTTSTTTTTTTTTPKPTTTSSTTARPNPYQTANQETIAALIALHNAFNQGLQGSKIKPAPPRVINNAFSPTKATIKPYSTYATQRSNVNPNFKSHYTADSQSYGSLNLQQRERPYYFTPSTEKSNYHHFHSSDTSFGHSFDVTRPYNYQYFHSRKLPQVRPSISVVTSTSTSTSVKTSKPNTTEYPTGYDDYQDDIDDSFFDDVPKLRQKRDNHPNHKNYEDVTTIRYKNHRYDDELISNHTNNEGTVLSKTTSLADLILKNSTQVNTEKQLEFKTDESTENEKDQFLQSLLGTIDMDDDVREKITSFFKQEEKELVNITKNGISHPMSDLGNAVGQVFTQGLNLTGSDETNTKNDKITRWKQYFDDMKKDISLNFTQNVYLTDQKNVSSSREKRDTRRLATARVTNPTTHLEERSQSRGIDTEKFQVEPRRGRPGRNQADLKPVFEAIQDDFTTLEYIKTSKRGRSQPTSTPSLRMLKFNYEITSVVPETTRRQIKYSRRRPSPSIEVRDFVHETDSQQTSRARPRIKVQKLGRATTVPRDRKLQAREEFTTSLPLQTKAIDTQQSMFTPEQLLHSTSNFQDSFSHNERMHSVIQTTPTPERHFEDTTISSRASEIHNIDNHHKNLQSSTPRTISRNRGRVRSRIHADPPITTTYATPITRKPLMPDPNFDCEGKVKGSFYADVYNDCRAFFICSQGEINGPLLKSHFACGDATKFNQRSRTCQAEDLVDCSVSHRYYHLNNDFLVPEPEEKLKGSFEPMKVS